VNNLKLYEIFGIVVVHLSYGITVIFADWSLYLAELWSVLCLYTEIVLQWFVKLYAYAVELVSPLYRWHLYCLVKKFRHALVLPGHTHSSLLALFTNTLSRRDDLLCWTAMFLSKCVCSENNIVNFVSQHGLWFKRMMSSLSVVLCTVWFVIV